MGVGNLRVGGTGKTPVVADLVGRAQEEGLRVGVLSRGYRAADGADEPGWLESRGALVEVDADRQRGCQALLRRGVDLILLDDALQTRHRPQRCLGLLLARDLRRPPRPLPAGPAREFETQAATRADLWLARHDGEFDSTLTARAEYAGAPLLHFRLRPVEFREVGGDGRRDATGPGPGPVLLVSGLARPQSFERDVIGCGQQVAAAWRFEDHWRPSDHDVRRLREDMARRGANWVLCPEKNARRLAERAAGALPLWSLRSEIEWCQAHPMQRVREWFPRGGN